MYDLRQIEPITIASVEEWLHRITPARARVRLPRGRYATYLLWFLSLLAGLAAATLLRNMW